MKLAVMQPYFFPYIGYFQLISAVDKFVIYDDVNFIKQGWINRNKILMNGNEKYFTIPLKNASSFRQIKEILIDEEKYSRWKLKFLKMLDFNYKKAPYFALVYSLLEELINAEIKSIAMLSLKSLELVCNYLELNTVLVESSTIYNNNYLKAQERVLDICKLERASIYINLSGGVNLYSKESFEKENVGLLFIKPQLISYKQFKSAFTPWLSIIDVMMFNPKEEIQNFMNCYELI